MTNTASLPSPLASRRKSPRIMELFESCDEIATANAGDTHAIASVLQKMIVFYYEDVRMQAMLSFWSALAAGALGIIVLLYAVTQTMSGGVTDKSLISLAAGVMSQFISGVSFYLYFKAARQFASFHICLERTNRYLLANTIVQGMSGIERSEATKVLVETIVSAPMLTIEAVTGKT